MQLDILPSQRIQVHLTNRLHLTGILHEGGRYGVVVNRMLTVPDDPDWIEPTFPPVEEYIKTLPEHEMKRASEAIASGESC